MCMGTDGRGRSEGDFLGYLKSEAGAAYDATLFGPEAARIEKGRARPCRVSTLQLGPQPLAQYPALLLSASSVNITTTTLVSISTHSGHSTLMDSNESLILSSLCCTCIYWVTTVALFSLQARTSAQPRLEPKTIWSALTPSAEGHARAEGQASVCP